MIQIFCTLYSFPQRLKPSELSVYCVLRDFELLFLTDISINRYHQGFTVLKRYFGVLFLTHRLSLIYIEEGHTHCDSNGICFRQPGDVNLFMLRLWINPRIFHDQVPNSFQYIMYSGFIQRCNTMHEDFRLNLN